MPLVPLTIYLSRLTMIRENISSLKIELPIHLQQKEKAEQIASPTAKEELEQ